jgi:hypothetical protein
LCVCGVCMVTCGGSDAEEMKEVAASTDVWREGGREEWRGVGSESAG